MTKKLNYLENLCNSSMEEEGWDEIIIPFIFAGVLAAAGVYGGYKIHQATGIPALFEIGFGVIGYGFGLVNSSDD